LKIRPAAVSDAGEIVRIHIRCWRENFLGLIDEAALQSIDESAWRNRQEERLASGTRKCLVAHTDHKILGFGECGPVRDSTYGPVGEILSLFVSPGEQGSGVGRLLFSALARRIPSAYRKDDARFTSIAGFLRESGLCAERRKHF
jgi:ribosomal protein S18 acetylase RimI-like enzyme